MKGRCVSCAIASRAETQTTGTFQFESVSSSVSSRLNEEYGAFSVPGRDRIKDPGEHSLESKSKPNALLIPTSSSTDVQNGCSGVLPLLSLLVFLIGFKKSDFIKSR